MCFLLKVVLEANRELGDYVDQARLEESHAWGDYLRFSVSQSAVGSRAPFACPLPLSSRWHRPEAGSEDGDEMKKVEASDQMGETVSTKPPHI